MSTTRKQNIGNAERVGRVVIGAALAILGLVVLFNGPAFWGLVGAIVALAVGVDLIVTGARGYCPLYARLGHAPRVAAGGGTVSAPSHQHNPGPTPSGDNAEGEGHGGHSMWLMVLCCIPMVIAVVLIAVSR